MTTIEIVSVKGKLTAQTLGEAICAAVRHDVEMQPAMGTSIHMPDGTAYDLRDTLWIVAGEGDDRDYGRLVVVDGEAHVAWSAEACRTPMCEGACEVYESREQAAEAASRRGLVVARIEGAEWPCEAATMTSDAGADDDAVVAAAEPEVQAHEWPARGRVAIVRVPAAGHRGRILGHVYVGGGE